MAQPRKTTGMRILATWKKLRLGWVGLIIFLLGWVDNLLQPQCLGLALLHSQELVRRHLVWQQYEGAELGYRRGNDDEEAGSDEAEVDDQRNVEPGEVAERGHCLPVEVDQRRPAQQVLL